MNLAVTSKADRRVGERDGWLVAAAVIALAVVVMLVVRSGQQPDGVASYRCPSFTGSTTTGGGDYLDGFVWNGVEYLRHEVFFSRSWNPVPRPRIGKQLTTVGCNLSERTYGFVFDIEGGRWPDRTATLMRTGSPVYVIRGFNHTCRITVHDGGEWKTYAAWDFDSGLRKPCV